ncbi:MAG: hypothetical protein QXS29_10600 [Nitrososphaeria archaeon]
MKKYLSNKSKANFQEKKLSKKLKISQTKNSGSGRVKADLISHKKQVLIECKRTDKDSISIKKEWLEKLEAETQLTHFLPILALEFGDKTYYMIVDSNFDLENFLEFLKKK